MLLFLALAILFAYLCFVTLVGLVVLYVVFAVVAFFVGFFIVLGLVRVVGAVLKHLLD